MTVPTVRVGYTYQAASDTPLRLKKNQTKKKDYHHTSLPGFQNRHQVLFMYFECQVAVL